MDKRRGKIDASVRAFAADERRRQEGHPSVEELVAYHRGELAEGACEPLQDHLALCEECSRLLLDLEGFPELAAPGEDHRLSDDDLERAMAALKARLRGEGSAGQVIPFPRSGEPPPPKKG